MGGSSSATVAKPISGYNQNMFSGLNLSNGVTNAAIASSPELRTADISGLQSMAQRQSLINALNSAQMEKELTPEIANVRGELSKQVETDLTGGPSTALSNLWLKQGLVDQIATGVDTGSGFARSALADDTRADFYDNRDKQQSKAAALLSANPQPVAGLDVGSLAGIQTQAAADNANARDNYKTTVLGFLGNQSSNVMNAFQQAMQMEAARRSGNAAAANAAAGAGSAQSGQLMGAGIGAAGAIAGAGLLAF
ncbi:MAG: hypothetical protein M0Q93_00845 [Terrimicrobiaceae bacterium]|jgi:hypothetical protein|nr:hypothetical protein [Terrimicrobiaceae bacterium]